MVVVLGNGMVLRGIFIVLVHLETLVLLVHKVFKELRVILVLLVFKAILVQMEPLV